MEKIEELLLDTLNSDWLGSYTEDVLHKVQLNFILSNIVIGECDLGVIGVAPLDLLGGGLSVVIKTTEEIDTDEYLDEIEPQKLFKDKAFIRFKALFETEILELCNIDETEENGINYISFDILFEDNLVQTMGEFIEHVKRYSFESENKEFIKLIEENKEDYFSINIFLEEKDITR